jgi:hypothetical protein
MALGSMVLDADSKGRGGDGGWPRPFQRRYQTRRPAGLKYGKDPPRPNIWGVRGEHPQRRAGARRRLRAKRGSELDLRDDHSKESVVKAACSNPQPRGADERARLAAILRRRGDVGGMLQVNFGECHF